MFTSEDLQTIWKNGLLKTNMEQAHLSKMMKLEDVPDLDLPIIEIDGRTELVIGIEQSSHRRPDIVSTVERSSNGVTLRDYIRHPDGSVGLSFTDKTIWKKDKYFGLYDEKLRSRGL